MAVLLIRNLLSGLVLLAWVQAWSQESPDFRSGIFEIPREALPSIRMYTWREGCPVPLKMLRWVKVSYYDFNGQPHHDGVLLIHKNLAEDVVRVFEVAWESRFPFASVQPMFRFQGNDSLAMANNNTSGFNCREKSGQPGVFSNHSYGTAIDINPMQNPLVKQWVDSLNVDQNSGGPLVYTRVYPELGKNFINREEVRTGMIVASGPVRLKFRELGWHWGGYWKKHKDYQHFEKAAWPALHRGQ